MSNLDRRPTPRELGGLEATAAGPALDLLPGREVLLGESTRVRRLLPTLGRRMIGAWAFVDHYGPDDVSSTAGMQVAPHPHTGLQTVSWLLEGEVHHRDSLGSDVQFGPG
jgi:quercetin 2,3-dioxygenase